MIRLDFVNPSNTSKHIQKNIRHGLLCYKVIMIYQNIRTLEDHRNLGMLYVNLWNWECVILPLVYDFNHSNGPRTGRVGPQNIFLQKNEIHFGQGPGRSCIFKCQICIIPLFLTCLQFFQLTIVQIHYNIFLYFCKSILVTLQMQYSYFSKGETLSCWPWCDFAVLFNFCMLFLKLLSQLVHTFLGHRNCWKVLSLHAISFEKFPSIPHKTCVNRKPEFWPTF